MQRDRIAVIRGFTQVQQYHNFPSKSNLRKMNGVVKKSLIITFKSQRSSSAAQPGSISNCRSFLLSLERGSDISDGRKTWQEDSTLLAWPTRLSQGCLFLRKES